MLEIIILAAALGVIGGVLYYAGWRKSNQRDKARAYLSKPEVAQAFAASEEYDTLEEDFDFLAWSLGRHKAGLHGDMNVWSCPLCAKDREYDDE